MKNMPSPISTTRATTFPQEIPQEWYLQYQSIKGFSAWFNLFTSWTRTSFGSGLQQKVLYSLCIWAALQKYHSGALRGILGMLRAQAIWYFNLHCLFFLISLLFSSRHIDYTVGHIRKMWSLIISSLLSHTHTQHNTYTYTHKGRHHSEDNFLLEEALGGLLDQEVRKSNLRKICDCRKWRGHKWTSAVRSLSLLRKTPPSDNYRICRWPLKRLHGWVEQLHTDFGSGELSHYQP